MNAREAQALAIIKELLDLIQMYGGISEVTASEAMRMRSILDKAQKFADKLEGTEKHENCNNMGHNETGFLGNSRQCECCRCKPFHNCRWGSRARYKRDAGI